MSTTWRLSSECAYIEEIDCQQQGDCRTSVPTSTKLCVSPTRILSSDCAYIEKIDCVYNKEIVVPPLKRLSVSTTQRLSVCVPTSMRLIEFTKIRLSS